MGIKILDKINAEQTAKLAEKNFPEFATGDIVRVSIKIKEGDKFHQDLHRAHVLLAQGRPQDRQEVRRRPKGQPRDGWKGRSAGATLFFYYGLFAASYDKLLNCSVRNRRLSACGCTTGSNTPANLTCQRAS